MISNLFISELKSILHFDHLFKPLTLFSGLNSTGKSTVIHALRMLFLALKGKEPLINSFGPFEELAFKKQTARSTTNLLHEIVIKSTFSDSNSTTLKLPSGTLEPQDSDRSYIFSYLSANRLGPQLHLPVSYSTDNTFDIGERGEYALDCLATYETLLVPENLIHQSNVGETLKFNVDAWLEIIAPGYKMTITKHTKHDISTATFNDFRPLNVGFGLSYTLPVIIATLGLAALVRSGQERKYIFAVENPEAHLHPKGQTEIGRLLALAAASGLQVLVETHSDYVLDGIRLAIKERELRPEDAVFLFFTLDENRETQVRNISANKQGKLDGWPEGFFDQGRKNKAELAGF